MGGPGGGKIPVARSVTAALLVGPGLDREIEAVSRLRSCLFTTAVERGVLAARWTSFNARANRRDGAGPGPTTPPPT